MRFIRWILAIILFAPHAVAAPPGSVSDRTLFGMRLGMSFNEADSALKASGFRFVSVSEWGDKATYERNDDDASRHIRITLTPEVPGVLPSRLYRIDYAQVFGSNYEWDSVLIKKQLTATFGTPDEQPADPYVDVLNYYEDVGPGPDLSPYHDCLTPEGETVNFRLLTLSPDENLEQRKQKFDACIEELAKIEPQRQRFKGRPTMHVYSGGSEPRVSISLEWRYLLWEAKKAAEDVEKARLEALPDASLQFE